MQKITARKRQILELAAQGKTDKEIARELTISVETVLSHWKSLREDLGAPSRTAVLARILMQEQSVEVKLMQEDRDELLLQLAESSRLRIELDEANAKLTALSERQATMLSQTMANTDRKLALALKKVDHLEALDTLTKRTRVMVHEGEYGASWRKFYMSDSIEFTGTTGEQWINGEVNFFDYIHPEFIEKNISQFAPFSQGTHRLALSYLVRTPEGDRQILDLLTCEIADDTGTGKYYGLSVDITDWADRLVEMAKQGHLTIEIS